MMREVRNPYAEDVGLANRIGGVIDRVVAMVSPKAGRERVEERLRTTLARQQAAMSGRTYDMVSEGRSADDDWLFDGVGETARARSRQLIADEPYAASIVQVFDDNVVGTGIRAQSRARAEQVQGVTAAQIEDWNLAVDDLFEEWASEEADASEHDDFYGLQSLIVRTWAGDGEALIHPLSVSGVPGRSLGMAFELIDVDRLSSPADADSDRIRGGVELGMRGQPRAYHILDGHPGDVYQQGRTAEPTRYRRFRDGRINMVHLFRRERPGQTRGRPFLAPATTAFHHLSKYLNYEVIAARSNASTAGFIVQNSPGELAPNVTFNSESRRYEEEVEAGRFVRLSPGESIESFTPNRPGITFDPYVVRSLRGIGASVGVPYELFALDMSRVNYTSSRSLLLAFYRTVGCMRRALTTQFLHPARRLVLRDAYLRRRLPRMPGFLRDERQTRALLRCAWIAPARGWVDPTKEIQASRDSVNANLSSFHDESASNGRDFVETARMNAKALRQLMDLEDEEGLPRGLLVGAMAEGAGEMPSNEEVDRENAEEDEQVIE